MLIRRAVLRNFGPYYGEQSIDLGPGQRPLTLVHGENMRGKTSLLNAIRWALYGQVKTRTGVLMPAVRLLNTVARDEGTYSYSVELELEDGQDKYVVNRQARANREPRKDADFELTIHVRKGKDFLSAEDSEVQVARLLPQAVAQFFLFDGEMLNDFEDLLADPTQQSQAIKASIEQILGVPALENSINDLSALHRDAERRRTQAAKQVSASQKDAERAEQLAAEIAAAEEDAGSLRRDIEATRGELASVDEDLRRFELVRSEAERLEGYRIDLAKIKAEIEEHRESRRRLMANAWLEILNLAVAPRLAALELEREHLVQMDREYVEVEAQRALLARTLNADTCPLCGSGLHAEEKERLQIELARLPLVDPAPRERLDAAQSSIARLRAIGAAARPSVGAGVEALERNLRRSVVRQTEVRNRITELETKLRDHSLSEIAQLQRRRDRMLKDLGGYEDAVRGAEVRLEMLRAQAAAVRLRIAQVSDPQLDRLNREAELYEGLLKVFRGALDDLIEELKAVIEHDASEVFLKLTTDKSYRGLRINDYYGLYIIDGSGNDVAVRSAGAEQIVALSLIAALNQNAVKSGPVIMDTPFGRLDVEHRANILSFLSTMAEQVVLLVHSGEVDRERDLAVVAPQVQREYELRYVSSAKTEIAPLAGSGGST